MYLAAAASKQASKQASKPGINKTMFILNYRRRRHCDSTYIK
jgi:hypothetical protein